MGYKSSIPTPQSEIGDETMKHDGTGHQGGVHNLKEHPSFQLLMVHQVSHGSALHVCQSARVCLSNSRYGRWGSTFHRHENGLVGGLEHFRFFHVFGRIIPID